MKHTRKYWPWKDNLGKFVLKAAILFSVVFITRAAIQFSIEYFHLDLLRQTSASTVFNKMNALMVISYTTLFFALFYREKIKSIDHPRFNIAQATFFFALGQSMVVVYYFLRYWSNLNPEQTGAFILALRIGIVLVLSTSFISLLASIFGVGYLKRLYENFKYPIMIAIISLPVSYAIVTSVQKTWIFFSANITRLLVLMFSPFFYVSQTFSDEAPILSVGEFTVSIGPECAGIESMILFFAFFAAIFALDYSKMRGKNFLILLAVGLAGMYFVNVLRLFLLILTGIYISPEFAIGMFHTNAGWILFVAYLIGYYALIKKYVPASFIYKNSLPLKNNDKK